MTEMLKRCLKAEKTVQKTAINLNCIGLFPLKEDIRLAILTVEDALEAIECTLKALVSEIAPSLL